MGLDRRVVPFQALAHLTYPKNAKKKGSGSSLRAMLLDGGIGTLSGMPNGTCNAIAIKEEPEAKVIQKAFNGLTIAII